MKMICRTLLISFMMAAHTFSRAQSQTTPVLPAGQSVSKPPVSVMSQNLAEAERLSQQVLQFYRAGKFGEAVPLAERAVSLREQAVGKDHAVVAVALSNLAALYSGLKKTDRARSLYERALAIKEAQVKPDEKDLNRLREILGTLYYQKGDYGRAEEFFSRILSSREKLYGPNDEEVTLALVNLAYIYLAMGNDKKINATYSRILEYTDQLQGSPPEQISRVFQMLSCAAPSGSFSEDDRRALLRRIDATPNASSDAISAGAIFGGVLNGKAIKKPVPAYPDEAKQARVQGIVLVQITVDESGQVIAAKPVCGPPLLYEASVRAARQALFSPTLLSGQPVKVTGTISYHFNLR